MDRIHVFRDRVNATNCRVNLAWRTLNPFARHFTLAWRTLNPFERPFNLAWETVNSIREQVNLAWRTQPLRFTAPRAWPDRRRAGTCCGGRAPRRCAAPPRWRRRGGLRPARGARAGRLR